MRPGPKKPGESAAEYSARVKAMEQKWMSGMGRPKTGGGASSGGGRRDMGPGSGGAPSSGGRGIVKGLPTPKKSAPREKVDLRDTKGQPIKDRKPVLYSGSGMKPGGGKMIANNPMTKMKRGGTVKGKK
jgi:hypothetical protein